MKHSWWSLLILLAIISLSGCFFGGKKGEVITPTGDAEPDKILYEKGLKDLEKGRFEIARLTFQTLLNTYADSDYKEKAKLAIADSFFKQGGTSGLIQAEAEYRDFMTFFPTSDDADDAQMRIAMTHYKQMEKPDRDRTQALAAEKEFKVMIDQFSESPLRDEAIQRLREVQEVLAEGDMRVAKHYMILKRYDASIKRSQTVLNHYKDFSGQDNVLFVMAQALEKKKQIVPAGYYYGKIVSDHPLSERVEESRKKLEDLNLPIPEVNPEALARAQAEKENEEKRSFMGRIASLFSKKPDVSSARKSARPSIDLAPEHRVNLEAAAPSTTVAPASDGIGATGDISAGVAAEIVTRPKSTTQGGGTSSTPGNAETSSAKEEGVRTSDEKDTSATKESDPKPGASDPSVSKEEGTATAQNAEDKGEKKKKKTGIRKILRF